MLGWNEAQWLEMSGLFTWTDGEDGAVSSSHTEPGRRRKKYTALKPSGLEVLSVLRRIIRSLNRIVN